MYRISKLIVCVVCTLLILTKNCSSLHLKGSWKSKEFFNFLSKFGFQQTNMNDKANTQGYIYGNITSAQMPSTSLTFVVTDSEYFLHFYGNRSVMPRTKACPSMFHKIQRIAWSDCNLEGREDFLRRIPCSSGSLCEDEDAASWVIPGYQFTYRVQDTSQPRFWYISMVSCHQTPSSRNITSVPGCQWTYNEDQDIVLDYDVWLVNGHPLMKHINPFEHQFSFDHHDIFEMYITFFVAYCFLVAIQLYALIREKHMMPILLTLSMGMEFVGVTFNLVHVLKFAFDGEGVDLLKVVGNFIDQLAQCIFMLLLLLIVKGWTITRRDLGHRSWIILFTLWATYTVANLGLFIWNLMEIDIISDIGEWQTWPGWLILVFRITIMIWFLFELRETVSMERSKDKMRFYLHFGAGFLVWFVYLPIVTVICTQISSLWRFKTILSVTYAADFLSYCVLVHLLWPSRSDIYFNLKPATTGTILMDDLEYTGRIHNKPSIYVKRRENPYTGRKKRNNSDSDASIDLYERARSAKKFPHRSANGYAPLSNRYIAEADDNLQHSAKNRTPSNSESLTSEDGQTDNRRTELTNTLVEISLDAAPDESNIDSGVESLIGRHPDPLSSTQI